MGKLQGRNFLRSDDTIFAKITKNVPPVEKNPQTLDRQILTRGFRARGPQKFWGAPKITHFRLSVVGNFPVTTCARSSLVDTGGNSRIAGGVWPPNPKNPKIGGAPRAYMRIAISIQLNFLDTSAIRTCPHEARFLNFLPYFEKWGSLKLGGGALLGISPFRGPDPRSDPWRL